MPDEKRIKDFEPATNLLIDDWFAVDSPSQGTRKIQKSMFMADEIASLQTLSTAMGNAQTDIGNLQTRAGMSQNLNFGDNLTDGVNILSVLLGAEPYVNTRTYAVGEYCIYEKQLYKCTTAVTSAEDFDSEKWTLTNVKTELTELNSSKVELEGRSYIVSQWVTFTYFNATQLEGTYTPPTVLSGYSYRLLGCMPIFANNALGAKFSGKFLLSAGNKLRALGTGFTSGESENFLVLFLIFKL